MKTLMALMLNDDGQTMVEYALLIALISVAAIAVLLLLGPHISGMFSFVDDTLETAETTLP